MSEEGDFDLGTDGELALLQSLIAEGKASKLSIYRYPDSMRLLEKDAIYITTVEASSFVDLDDIMQYCRKLVDASVLPARFKIHFRGPDGRIKTTVRFVVDADPKEDARPSIKQQDGGAATAAAAAVTAGQREALDFVRDVLSPVLRQQGVSPPPAPRVDWPAMIAALGAATAPLFGLLGQIATKNSSPPPAVASDPMVMVEKSFALAEKMAKRMAGEEEEEPHHWAVEIADRIVPLVKNFADMYRISAQQQMLAARQNVPSLPKHPRRSKMVKPTSSASLLDQIRQYRSQFVLVHKAATAGVDPQEVAEEIYSSLPDEISADDVLNALEKDENYSLFFQAFQEASSCKEWYDRVRDELLKMAREDIAAGELEETEETETDESDPSAD